MFFCGLARVHLKFARCGSLDSSSFVLQSERHKENHRGEILSKAKVFESSNNFVKVVREVDLCHMAELFR